MSHFYHEEGHVHLLTFSCYKRLWLFKGEPFYSLFLDYLDKARVRFNFLLYAYVIMPNHVHLVIYPLEKVDIAKILHSIKRPFAHKAIPLLEYYHPELASKIGLIHGKREIRRFWQPGGGYDRNIYGEKTIIRTIEYIHYNPVRKNLVEYPEDWKWSSAGFWMKDGEGKIKVDIPDAWKGYRDTTNET